jgi:outer membrane lipoprotein SlyB
MSVRIGTVVAVRDVKIEGTGAGGALTGAALGGLAGVSHSGGKTGAALGIIGLVGGAMIGDAIGKGITSAPGLEVTVQLAGGGLIAIVQERDVQLSLKAGDQVRITGSGRTTRVGPL